MRDFIRNKVRSPRSDERFDFVIIYYVGHGSHDQQGGGLIMPLRSTDSDFIAKTSVTAVDFWTLIRKFENDLVFLVILDCCFAAEFARQAMSTPDDVLTKEFKRMPSRGTAFLGAASAENIAINEGNSYTVFSEGLLHALETGLDNGADTLSLDEVFHLAKDYIEGTFKDRAVIPQIHSPAAPDGPVAQIRFFPNPRASVGRNDPAVATDAITKFCQIVFARLQGSVSSPPNWSAPYARTIF
jgi:hypothetical protein